MYQENCPLTDEVVNIYADNIPAVEGTMLDVALPLRKQHFEVKKSDLFYSILDGSDRKNQKDYNDVLDVIPLVSSIKAEVGKIDIASTFELVLERPLEEVSEEANKPVFVSSEPEILDIDEEGNMTAKTDLGQTIVTLTWPSGVTAQILVTIGEVSEVKPYEPELGGDIVEPEQPEGGEDPDTPVDPNPEPEPEPEPDPEEPEEPEEPEQPEDPIVEPAMIMYGYMPIAEHMESMDAITAEDLAAVEYTKVDVAPLEKTLLPAVESNFIVVLIPASSELVAYRDNGFGSMEAFYEDIMGCNGQRTYIINGVEYKLYTELQIVSASVYFIYVA